MNRSFLAFSILLGVLSKTSYGQASKESNERLALQYVRDLYAEKIGEQSRIYNGSYYTGYPHPIKEGIPYFLTAEASNGEIYYDGMLYKNVPMWYDISKNKVVVLNSGKLSKISLDNDKIDHFTLLNHYFINIDSNTAQINKLRQGFYDQIYKGELEFLIKRSKELLTSTDQAGVWVSFSNQKNFMYLKKDNMYYAVSSQKSILDALGKFEKEILQHLKQNKLKFRKNREQAIIMMLSYYDKLNSQV